jgi:hypothetical protein
MTRIITRVASHSRRDKQGLPAHASHQLRHELREQLKDPSIPPSVRPSVPSNNERDQRTINQQQSPTLQFGWMVVGSGVFH